MAQTAASTPANAKMIHEYGEIARDIAHAARSSGATDPAQLVEQEKILCEALTQALRPDSAVAGQFTQQLCSLIPALSGAHGREAVNQIFARRAEEQQRWLAILEQDTRFHSPQFLAQAMLLPPSDPSPKLVEILAQTSRSDGPEPIIHILAQADGQRIWHQALADCWKPEGPVHQQLRQSLYQLLPQCQPAVIEQAVDAFIEKRYSRAVDTTLAMLPDSKVVIQALEISRHGRGHQPTADPHLGF